MAENQNEKNEEDLSEEVSPYRLEEFKKSGKVVQSRELTSLLSLTAIVFVLLSQAGRFATALSEYLKKILEMGLNIGRLESAALNFKEGSPLASLMREGTEVLLLIALPVSCMGFVVAVISSFAQIGPIFSWEPLSPDWNKLNPITGIARFFSKKQAIETLRLLLKIGVCVWISAYLVQSEVLKSPLHLQGEASSIAFGMFTIAKAAVTSLLSALFLFASIDFCLQKFDFQKSLRMTKQEAKQDFKEREGDPHIRSRIRSIQRDLARRRMMTAVKKADVLVTNPTHLAIALSYQKDKMVAPRVIAKGADLIAQKMKQIAIEAGVPLVENVPLARSLYAAVKVNQAIPKNLYQAVAEVLAYVYKLKRNHF